MQRLVIGIVAIYLYVPEHFNPAVNQNIFSGFSMMMVGNPLGVSWGV